MKHAGTQALASLAGLLDRVRRLGAFTEKSPGSFYLRSRAVLHFHEDALGLFADVRTTGDWERLPVNSRQEQNVLQERLRTWVASILAKRKASRTSRKGRADG